MIFIMIVIMIFINIPSVAKEQKAEREDESEPRHFIDVYLAEMEKNPNDFTFEELCRCFVLIYSNLLYHSIIFDFFSAGTETSSTTMKWAVLFLSINQVFDKRKDLTILSLSNCPRTCKNGAGRRWWRCWGTRRSPWRTCPRCPMFLPPLLRWVLTKKNQLRFLRFFQIQRIARVAPSSIPHTSTASTTVTLPNSKTTYTFPKGSNFMANISFIMNDPKHFVDPDKFNPERFINENGK